MTPGVPKSPFDVSIQNQHSELLAIVRDRLGEYTTQPVGATFHDPDGAYEALAALDGIEEQMRALRECCADANSENERLEEQLEALREAADTARGWLYHGLNRGGMKSAREAFDVLDAEFHSKASTPATEASD